MRRPKKMTAKAIMPVGPDEYATILMTVSCRLASGKKSEKSFSNSKPSRDCQAARIGRPAAPDGDRYRAGSFPLDCSER